MVKCVCKEYAYYHGSREGMQAIPIGKEIFYSDQLTPIKVSLGAKDYNTESTNVGIKAT